MNDLTTGAGISESLKRRYGIVDERPVQTLATDLFPVIDAADGAIPDLAFPGGVRLCCGFGSSPATVAEYSQLYLRNPTGSGTLIVVRRSFTTSGGSVRIYFDDPGTVGTLIGVAGRVVTDTRSGTSATVHQLPSGEIRIHHTATPGGIVCAQIPATTLDDLPPIVLVPGTAIALNPTLVNTTINGHIEWMERALQQWENFRTI